MASGMIRLAAAVLASAWLAAAETAPFPSSGLPELTNALQVLRLSASEAERAYPVQLRGVVTYFNRGWNTLFIQDASAGVFVGPPYEADVRPGQLLEVTGVTSSGEFAPMVTQTQLRVLAEDQRPEPRRVTFEDITFGWEDSQWVEVEGLVRAADVQLNQLRLELAAGSGKLIVWVMDIGSSDGSELELVEARVRIRGVCAAEFNSKRQMVGARLLVSSRADIIIEQPPPLDPFAAPPRAIETLLQYSQRESGQRVKVQGVVTYFRKGQSLFLRDDTDSLRTETRQTTALAPGDRVEVVGFPAAGEQTPILQNAVFRRIGSGPPPRGEALTSEQILRGAYHAELVQIRGKLVDHAEWPRGVPAAGNSGTITNQLTLVLEDGKQLFEAVLAEWPAGTERIELRSGSQLQLTGICVVELPSNRLPGLFRLLLRSPEDIIVVANASWWTQGRAFLALGLCAFLALAGAGWGLALKKRVRAQTQALRERLERESALEKRYRDVVEGANDLVYTHDLEGNFTSLNPAGERITGYSREEARKLNFFQLSASDHLSRVQDMLAQQSLGSVIPNIRLDLMTKQGRRITVEISSRPILEHGKVVGAQAIARDITQRKQAEDRAAALSSLGQRLSLAATSEEAAWIVAETADKLLGWDACYMHLLTPDLQRIIPVLNYDLVDGKRAEVPWVRVDRKVSPMDEKVISEGPQLILRAFPPEATPGLVAFGDTKRLSASLMFVPIRHRLKNVGTLSIQSYRPNAYDRNALSLLQSLADFCAGAMDRLQAAAALRESEERFSQAFRLSPIPMNINSLQEGRYLEVNDSLVRLLGYSREEVLGRTSVELGIWADPEDRPRIVQRVLAENLIHDVELRVRRKNGEIRTVLASFGLIQIRSEACLIGISYDVTDRQQMEVQLRHAQKMEAVGQLAAGIAHDFNNIMTIIQGYTAFVRSTAQGNNEAEEALQEIATAADRAARLTRQLLTFSRKQVMQSRPLEVNELVQRVTTMLGRILGEHIDMECAFAEGLPAIQADAGMMEQLITNLAMNARDAMPNGGRLTVATALAAIDADYVKRNPEARLGRFVRVSVSDTGCGMEPSILPRLFEPFFTTKDVGKGTGLGLATAYGIVKQHEGWIDVSTEIGKGSTFSVFFPALAKKPAGSPRANEAKPLGPGGHETILLVEDEPGLRRLSARVLQRLGYRVLEAESGVQALAVWKEHAGAVDLLLTDVIMPAGLNGRDLAERLQSEKPHLKIIYSSGYSMEALGRDFVLRDGVMMLAKPYQPTSLARAVRECLDQAAKC